MKRALFLLLTMGWLWCQGQPLGHVTFYDEEDGLPHGHVTQLLQDEQGFMWFATWNGLCRYDGYEFRTFKSYVGDGCHLTTDRFRDIALRPDGTILCRVDEDYCLFNPRTCQFFDLPADELRCAADDIKRYRMSQTWQDASGQKGFAYVDRQGNRWLTGSHGVSKQTAEEQHTIRLPIMPEAQVKCLFVDRSRRYWVATKDDGAVRLFDAADDRLIGYLGADGRLHSSYTRFGASVYSMYQSDAGTLWLGTKPDGLFRLHETQPETFKIDHFTDIPNPSIYNMTEDIYGRLWIATLGGGLCYTSQPEASQPRFRTPRGYPQQGGQRVRYLLTSHDGQLLMAATTDGLMVARIKADADRMRFQRHQREPDRAESLSSSATMDLMQDACGRYFVSTESGGVNRIETADVLSERLSFMHYTAGQHQLPSDVVMSVTQLPDSGVMVVGSHVVTLVDSTGHYRVLDARYFNSDYRFSDARPQYLGANRWLFGLMDGAFVTTTDQMYRQAYAPRVVLTSVSIQGSSERWNVAYADTLLLSPRERSLTVRFAALDFAAASRISYTFRMQPNEEWNYIGHDRSATLLDLQPGVYHLEIRSTNADGQWVDNVRRLTIVVRPTFWESLAGRLLIALLVAGMLAIIIYTILYIRRIKRKQRETLQAYLALLEDNTQDTLPQPIGGVEKASTGEHLQDATLQRVMAFIEQNISNSDASVGDMAAAAAVSRSGLQRKLKQTMGITPQDLLYEARIKHACQLLLDTGRSVADVAYACGFTDPKYFSRRFKQSIGKSPTDYKQQVSQRA